MNYCSHCGSDNIKFEIPEGDTRPRFVCGNCGRIHYHNPKIVVGCLIEHEGKILLGKRGIEPKKGMWNIPQGFMEVEETIEQGAARETFEETGVLPTIEKLITVYSVPHANQVHIHFLANINSTKWVLSEESPEVKLFEKDAIPWDEIAFSSNHFTLKAYIANGSSKVFVGQR